MLTLTFLGVGSAFARRNFQSNALIEAWTHGPDRQAAPDDTLLIDFGATGPQALHQLRTRPGFSYLDRNGAIYYPALPRVLITHLHNDHVGGLEELAIMNRFRYGDGSSKPRIISTADILTDLWEHCLSGGLRALPGRHASLADYFLPQPLTAASGGGADQFTLLDRYVFSIFPTDHMQVHRPHDWTSCGLLITDGRSGETAFYSGDTRFDPHGLGEMMSAATLNFHEVQLEDPPVPVHAPLRLMRTLPETIRRKTVLYHYEDTWDDPAYAFVADEFAGFAQPHRRYTLFP